MIERYVTVILATIVFAVAIKPAAAQFATHRPGQWQLPMEDRVSFAQKISQKL
jgi:F0F1-type ATP synthase membrane subunit a